MSTESNEMDKQRRKSMQKSAKAIFKKAEDREKAGGDYFETGWQEYFRIDAFNDGGTTP